MLRLSSARSSGVFMRAGPLLQLTRRPHFSREGLYIAKKNGTVFKWWLCRLGRHMPRITLALRELG